MTPIVSRNPVSLPVWRGILFACAALALGGSSTTQSPLEKTER